MEFERCEETLLGNDPDDPSRCALPKGHVGMHTPLPVLWQMAGFAEGPWSPDSHVEVTDGRRTIGVDDVLRPF